MVELVRINLSGLAQKFSDLLGLGTSRLDLDLLRTVQPVVDIHEGARELYVEVPSTAGNVSTVINFGNRIKYRIKYGQIWLDTDATVADRFAVIYIMHGTDNMGVYASNSTAVAANGIGYICPMCVTEVAFTNGGYHCVPVGEQWVRGEESLQVTIGAGVAGDAYTVKLLVEVMGV